jgi:hypothetical protein
MTTKQTFPGGYPDQMRRQLWPLCCGASILSGFKHVHGLTDAQLVDLINKTLAEVPDFQVFKGEDFKPKCTFLTLNHDQMASKKIMNAIKKCGFVKIGEAQPRYGTQGFFLLDTSNSWKAA